MSYTTSSISDQTSVASAEIPAIPSKPISLRQSVREFLRQHFIQMDSLMPHNVYEIVLTEVEIPMLEIVLQYVKQNQSKAARILAMSRGNLRKKMKQCGLLPSQHNKMKSTKKITRQETE